MAVLLSTATWIACDKQEESPILNQYGDAADPAELSAGSSTIFATGVTAYDTPADWVQGNLSTRFYQGDALYDNPRVSGDDPNQGGERSALCRFFVRKLPLECRAQFPDTLFARRNRNGRIFFPPDLHHQKERPAFSATTDESSTTKPLQA